MASFDNPSYFLDHLQKLFNHWKAFEMAFFYINYGFI
jgi:hypothetical protein